MPLFLTEAYVKNSLDVFPIEYLNFQREHSLVFGKDVFKDLSFDREHLRLQCEREIKGKLLLLREALLDTAGKGKALKAVIGQSISAFIAIFEALLYLKGKDVPQGKGEIIRAAAEAYERDAGVFEKLLHIKEERMKPGDAEILGLYKEYVKEVRELSKQVDQLGGRHE
ncbi:MAG: hypothetical protein GY849_03365 [Deltaproteobacteria bacterium]|nr:hypothetical protein [Deltaproteobacteria bacterium]